jgi:hypothetical protein
VKEYRFIRPEPVSLRVLGLTGRSAVVLWVQNRESMWYDWNRPSPPPVTRAQLVIHGVPRGRMHVEWLDTWTGRRIGESTLVVMGDTVTLAVPSVRRDVACRLVR